MLPTTALETQYQLRVTVLAGWNTQAPHDKNAGDGQLLRPLHLQFPKIRDGKYHDGDIGREIGRDRPNIGNQVEIQAVTRDRFVPPILQRYAAEE